MTSVNNRAWAQTGLLFIVVAGLLGLLLHTNEAPVIPITVENVTELQAVLRLGDGSVYTGAWSPDGTQLALAGSIGIWIYDANSLDHAPRLLDGHTGRVHDVTYNPDGTLLASGSSDGSVRLWDVATWETIAVFEDTEPNAGFNDVLFSPDGRYLTAVLFHIGTIPTNLVLWDVANRAEIATLTGHTDDVNSIAFSPDSQLLASMDTDFLYVWDVPNAQALLTLEPQRISSSGRVVFSNDGQYLIAGQIMPSMNIGNIWQISDAHEFTYIPPDQAESLNLSTAIMAYQQVGASTFLDQTRGFDIALFQEWAQLQSLGSPSYSPYEILVISPDGERVLIHNAAQGQWEVWNTDGAQQTVIHHDIETLYDAYFSQRANSVVATSSYSTQLWNLNTGQHISLDLLQAGGYVSAVFFDEHHQPVGIFGNWMGSVSLLDLRTGATVQTIDGAIVQDTLTISPDLHYFATNGQTRNTVIWDIQAETIVSDFAPDNPELAYQPLAFSPDNQLIATAIYDATCECRQIDLFDVQTGARLNRLGEIHRNARTGIFSPDGNLFIAGGAGQGENSLGGNVTVWDIATGEQIAYFDDPRYSIDVLMVSPDGRMVAGRTLIDVWLWDIYAPTENAVRVSLVPEGEFEDYSSMAFNPQGDLFAVGTSWGEIQLYAVTTGELLNSFHAHNWRVTDLQFSDDGATLISTGMDATVRLWRSDTRLITIRDAQPIALPTYAITPTVTPDFVPTITPTVAPIGD